MRTISISIRKAFIKRAIVLFSVGAFMGVISTVYAAFSCSITTVCNSPNVVIFRMSSTTNAHAELPNQSNYSQLVCCGGVTGVGNSCSGTYAVAAKLYSATNAHVEKNDQSNYSNSVCLSNSSGGGVSIAYQASNCTGYDTTMASISGVTNAHVGSSTVYTTKICATAAAPSLTFAVDSGSQSLPAHTPGSLVATSSIITVNTNNATGFNVSVQRNNAGATMTLTGDITTTIPDKTVWIAPAATTTTGNATASTTEASTLQFRIRQAGTDYPNYASSWWGASDTTTGALFAGIPSSSQYIINRSTPAVASTTAYVLYDLNVPITQKTGNYTGDVTYTVVANP